MQRGGIFRLRRGHIVQGFHFAHALLGLHLRLGGLGTLGAVARPFAGGAAVAKAHGKQALGFTDIAPVDLVGVHRLVQRIGVEAHHDLATDIGDQRIAAVAVLAVGAAADL